MGFEAATSPQSRSSTISGSKLGTQKSEADHRQTHRERQNRDTDTDTDKERETERDSLWSPPLSWQRWAFDGLLRIWLMNFMFQIWGFNIGTAVAVVRVVVGDSYTFVVQLSFLGFEVEGREESKGEDRIEFKRKGGGVCAGSVHPHTKAQPDLISLLFSIGSCEFSST